MDVVSLSGWPLILGVVLMGLGLFLALAGRLPFVGRLPDDILVQRGGLILCFPVVTLILISVVLTIVLSIALRLLGSR